MISRILVGVDGTRGAADALALARGLASPESEILAVSVATLKTHTVERLDPLLRDAAREHAAEHLASAREQQLGLEGEIVTAFDAATGLHRSAEVHVADLIVIGSCHRGPVGRILAGDDTLAILRGAPCPVAVAPRDFALGRTAIETVGLGWDASPDADHALAFARGLAEDLGAGIHAVAVVEASEGSATVAEIAAEVSVMSARALELDGVTAAIVTGVASEQLDQLGAEVDVLVVGSRQRGALARIVLGSTSETLVRRSRRPVIVVPRVPQPAAV